MQEEKIDEMLRILKGLDSKTGSFEDRMDKVESRLDNIESRLDNVETRLGNVESRLDNVETRLDKVENRMDSLENRMDNLDQNIIILNQKIIESERNQNRKLAYFEHVYGEKIAAIFDKLKLNDDIRDSEKLDQEKLKKEIELSSAKILMHDYRISKLEKNVSSK